MRRMSDTFVTAAHVIGMTEAGVMTRSGLGEWRASQEGYRCGAG